MASVSKERCSTRGRDRVGARAEARAVDALDDAGLAVRVEHDELAGHGAAVLVGDEAQLLARRAAHREQRLDVVHHRVRLDLVVEARLLPVLALVVGVSLGGEVVALDQLLREAHHAQGLGEALHGVDGQRAHLLRAPDLEVAARRRVGDVLQRAHGEGEVGLVLLQDLLVHAGGGVADLLEHDRVLLRDSRPPPPRRARWPSLLAPPFARLASRLLLRRHAHAFRLRSSTAPSLRTTSSRCTSENSRICCRPIATCGMYFSM